MVRLFAKFQVIYSHKWTSAIDNDELYALALEEWSERLYGLSADDIATGLANLKSEWPPTPNEFKELCIGDNLHNTGAYKPFQKKLEPPRDKELAKEKMSEIKAMLSQG